MNKNTKQRKDENTSDENLSYRLLSKIVEENGIERYVELGCNALFKDTKEIIFKCLDEIFDVKGTGKEEYDPDEFIREQLQDLVDAYDD